MLTIDDVASVIPQSHGIVGVSFDFHTISLRSDTHQPKSLYVHVSNGDSLATAIQNGAVAAIWPQSVPVPDYAPNHFPVFLADSPTRALHDILDRYTNKITLKTSGEKTNIMITFDTFKNESESEIVNSINNVLGKGSNEENRREKR